MKADNEKLSVNIEIQVGTFEELKQAAKVAAEIQKEYSCNCTLNVKL